MERLTEQRQDMMGYFTPKDGIDGMDCVQKLAAYEDTGLEPEGVKVILDRYVKLRSLMPGHSGEAVDDDATFDHLSEICSAAAEEKMKGAPDDCKGSGDPEAAGGG